MVAAAVAALNAAAPDGVVAQTVGAAGAVNPQAQSGDRVLNVGSSIIFRERVSTSASGSTQVIFVDRTTLSVGPNSNILIDEFVYNPKSGSGRMTVTLLKGALRMVGGDASHTQGATIKTPIAVIGVRGGVATVKHDASSCPVSGSRAGARNDSALERRESCRRARGTQAINHFGTLTVTSGPPGARTSVTITRPGYGVSVQAAGTAPSAPAPVPQSTLAALSAQLTSQSTQSGGVSSGNRPTEASVVAAGVGQTNANLVPSQVQSVHAQNASLATASTVVQPAQLQSLAQVTEQIVQLASQQPSPKSAAPLAPPPSAPPPPPLPAFYALAVTPDPALRSGVPYLPAGFAVPGAYVVTDVLGYRRGGINPATDLPRFGSLTLQAGLSINGSGASQTSTFFVMTGGFTALANGTQFYSAGFDASTYRAANQIGFASGSVGGDAANTTLNSDHIPTGALFDNNSRDGTTGAVITNPAFYFPGNGTRFNYTFSQSAIAAPPPPGIGAVRPDTALTGFVGGIARTLHTTLQFPNDTSYSFVGPSYPIVGGIIIQFDPSQGRMQANATLTKDANFNGNINEFTSGDWQIGNLNPNARSRSTYIDDRLFGGRSGVNEPATTNLNFTEVSTTNGVTLDRSRQAFASSDLVQAQTFFPGVNFSSCTCEYTRWGFWSADNYRPNPDGKNEVDRANLMTWVAGRLAAAVDVPNSGTAVYNGFVVGSFKNVNNQYLAAANFTATANFGSGNGTVLIPNLDGRNYGGGFTIPEGHNALTGTLVSSGTSGASMAITGAFFNGATDPVKDVAGRFTVTAPVSTNYIGAGIFAGSR
jgi:hypothetical protein